MQGYTGPLCGSCEHGYGTGLSSKCKRCFEGFFSVFFILLSVLFLVGLTGITIRGTLSVPRGRERLLHRQRAMPSSAGQVDAPLLEEQASFNESSALYRLSAAGSGGRWSPGIRKGPHEVEGRRNVQGMCNRTLL